MFPFHSVNKKGTIVRNGLKYPGSLLTKVRSSKRKCSMKKADLKTFAIFTIFAGLQACIFIKKRLQHRCFPVNIENTYSEKQLRTAASITFPNSSIIILKKTGSLQQEFFAWIYFYDISCIPFVRPLILIISRHTQQVMYVNLQEFPR